MLPIRNEQPRVLAYVSSGLRDCYLLATLQGRQRLQAPETQQCKGPSKQFEDVSQGEGVRVSPSSLRKF